MNGGWLIVCSFWRMVILLYSLDLFAYFLNLQTLHLTRFGYSHILLGCENTRLLLYFWKYSYNNLAPAKNIWDSVCWILWLHSKILVLEIYWLDVSDFWTSKPGVTAVSTSTCTIKTARFSPQRICIGLFQILNIHSEISAKVTFLWDEIQCLHIFICNFVFI